MLVNNRKETEIIIFVSVFLSPYFLAFHTPLNVRRYLLLIVPNEIFFLCYYQVSQYIILNTDDSILTHFRMTFSVLSALLLSQSHGPVLYLIMFSFLFKLLKPGGKILFRDYGRYDMAQLRFKNGRFRQALRYKDRKIFFIYFLSSLFFTYMQGTSHPRNEINCFTMKKLR